MTRDFIRCQECRSIDPSLYSDRIQCCMIEVVEDVLVIDQGIQLILWNTKAGFGRAE